MAITLLNLVISSIRRNDNNLAISTTRPLENDVSKLTDNTKEKLLSIFNTTGLRLGRFDTEPERPLFARILDKQLNKDTNLIENFQELGSRLGLTLASELNRGQAQNAKDGFLLTYYYSIEVETEEPEDADIQYYLGVIFLHRVDGVDIDIDNLELKAIEQINLDSLNLGARVNITSFLNDSDEQEKPISFKIGRGSDVRKFFQEFIGCNEPSNAKVDSANLLLALEDVCRQLGFNVEQTKNATDKLQSYCNAVLLSGNGQAEIANLAGFIFNDEEQKFKFLQVAQDDYQLSEHIGIDQNEINKFDDIIVKTKSYRVSFKDDAINETVFWDPVKNEITFGDLPKDTIEKMNRRFPEIK